MKHNLIHHDAHFSATMHTHYDDRIRQVNQQHFRGKIDVLRFLKIQLDYWQQEYLKATEHISISQLLQGASL